VKYLLDTNVVSAPRVRGRDPQAEAWAVTVPLNDQFVSVFTIAEIEQGVIAKEWFDAALIAAIADSNGMTVVTGDSKHSDPLGVPCLNPWEE